MTNRVYAFPERQGDDRLYDALSELAGIETYGTNLRDCSKAYEVMDRLMSHAYSEGRKDEREEWAVVLDALVEERRVRLLGQEPNVHWESMRDIRRACYAATDAAISRATGEQQ